jgi:hypothetical protein
MVGRVRHISSRCSPYARAVRGPWIAAKRPAYPPRLWDLRRRAVGATLPGAAWPCTEAAASRARALRAEDSLRGVLADSLYRSKRTTGDGEFALGPGLEFGSLVAPDLVATVMSPQHGGDQTMGKEQAQQRYHMTRRPPGQLRGVVTSLFQPNRNGRPAMMTRTRARPGPCGLWLLLFMRIGLWFGPRHGVASDRRGGSSPDAGGCRWPDGDLPLGTVGQCPPTGPVPARRSARIGPYRRGCVAAGENGCVPGASSPPALRPASGSRPSEHTDGKRSAPWQSGARCGVPNVPKWSGKGESSGSWPELNPTACGADSSRKPWEGSAGDDQAY